MANVNLNGYHIRDTSSFPMGRQDAVLEGVAGEVTNTLGTDTNTVTVKNVPIGMVFLPSWLRAKNIDTNAVPTGKVKVILTDGTTTKTLVAEATLLASGAESYHHGLGDAVGFITDNDNYQIQVIATASSATAGASGEFTVGVSYNRSRYE